MEPMLNIPLTKAIKTDLIPLDKINPPQDLIEFLDKIIVTNYKQEVYPNQSGGNFEYTLSTTEELVLDIPAIEGFALVFGGSGGNLVTVGADLQNGDYTIKLGAGLRIRVSRNVLKPVVRSNGAWIDDPSNQYAYIPFTAAILIDSDWNVSFEGSNEFSVGPAMIGDSGFVIEGTLAFDFSENSSLPETIALGLGDAWQGAIFKSLKLHLPDDLDVPILPSDLTLTNFHIGSGGIAGTIAGNWNPTINGTNITGNGAGTLFGMSFGLKSLSVSLVQNSFTEFELKGAVGIPFFESALNVTLGIDHKGNINVALDSPTGLASLTIPNVLEMELSSVEFEVEDGVFAVKLGGSLKPLVAGIDWPEFELKSLSIDSNGDVKIEGGWLDLPDQYSIDFFGFQLEITQIGFGKNDNGSKWLGFSGGLKLVDGFEAGASVEGLRITWGVGDPKISFNGIGVEFEVPGALRFKGAVSFKEFEQLNPVSGLNETVRRFDGEISLQLIALNLQIDANLVIGSAKKPDNSSYSFFAIYLGTELPAGIPLFTTGLALYGLAGLFALQMEPNKAPDEPWYGLGEGEGWYKKPEIGVTDLKNKWINVENSFALGAGVTIGTLPDNGFTFSGKFLLVFVLPGPIIMLEGKANMLKQRSQLDEEPIFRSIAVLDGREGSFLFGLDAQYKFGEGGELVEIGGGVEAFFSFSDPMAWYLYIGQKEPREKRIRAQIFKLFEANTYFMLDAYKLAMGAWVGYDKTWSFGPLKLTVEAWLEHNVVLSWNPAFLYGDIWAHGKVELSVFGFGLGLSIDARLAGQVFEPFWIKGEFKVGINLPWPLPDFSVDVSVQWGPKKVAPPIPAPLKEASIEHLKVSTAWQAPLLGAAVDANGIPQNKPADFTVPVVPLDARPAVTFNKSVHDMEKVGVSVHNPQPAFEIIGDAEKNEGSVKVKYQLNNVILQKFEGGAYIDVAGKNLMGIDDIFGSWAPEPKQISSGDPDDLQPGQSKLLVWSKTPYDYNRQINKTWDEWFDEQFDNYPCPSLPKDKEYCYDFEDIPEQQFFIMQFAHPKNAGLGLFWVAPTFNAVQLPPNPSCGKTKAFCFPRGNNSELVGLDNNIVVLYLPEMARKVKLCLQSNDELVIQVIGENPLNPGNFFNLGNPINSGAGYPDEVEIEYPINVIRGFQFSGSFCLFSVCYTVGPSWEDVVGYGEAVNHLNSEMARWADEGSILEPYTQYRLKILSGFESQAEDSEYAGDPAFERTESFEDYIYFRTEGPPGLVQLSAANNPVADESGEGSNQALQTLELYVRQTIPASVPAKGEKPPLPKPVYRSYDVGIDFNEDYVDLMYKIAQRDLGLYLYDNNAQPVRDPDGKLIVLTNQWGTVEELTLLESSSRYIEQINDGNCSQLDTSIIPKDSRLSSLAAKRALSPDTLYEARLVPLLYQDHFQENNNAWQEDTEGTLGGPAQWTWVQHPDIEGSGLNQTSNSLTLNGNPDLSDIDPKFDSIVLNNDQARPNKTYRILTVDNVTKEITVDAAPQLANPASTAWLIPAIGAVVQTSNVYGGTLAPSSPDKKGTILFLKDRNGLPANEQPSAWSDYRFTTVLHPVDNDGIGVVFRYRNSNGTKAYYRFAMNQERQYRRLVKVINGAATILAEDTAMYTPDQDYQITVEAIGESIKVYQNGQLVFDVLDDNLSKGSIGLYCWAQDGGRFDQVRVDDFSDKATVVYRFNFTTGWYANFFHHLHSYLDETWRLTLPEGGDLAAAQGQAVVPTTPATEAEYRAYADLAQVALQGNAHALPPEVQVSRIAQGNATKGWLLQSPEPILWDRVALALKRTALMAPSGQVPGPLKLTALNFSQASPDEEYVELLLKTPYDLNGVQIQYPGFNGVPLSQQSQLLFEDDFNYTSGLLYREQFGSNALNKYTIIDTGSTSGPSSWQVVSDAIQQSANIYGGDIYNSIEAPGTVALIGKKQWNNIRIQVGLRSTDNDSIGLVFRYQNNNNYYRFSMDAQRSYRRLVQVKNGVVSILWEDSIGYTPSQTYALDVFLYEKTILLYLDQVLLYSGDVLELEGGRLGYYCWANTGANFEGLLVYALASQPRFYPLDVANPAYTIVDEEDTVAGPSEWVVQGNTWVQESNIYSAGNFAQKRGTFALLETAPLADVSISVKLRSEDNDMLGVVFRVQEDPITGVYSYYRFTMDRQAAKRRLEKKVGAAFTLLWQDNFAYQVNVTYAVTVVSTATTHRVYVDGVLLTEVNDGSLLAGGVGLFSWANRGAHFEDVVVCASSTAIGPWQIVDEGTSSGPSQWWTDGESFHQRSNIHSSDLPKGSGTLAIAGESNWTNYSFKTQLKSQDDDGIGVVFRYQNTQNYYRFSMDEQRQFRRLVRVKDGVATILQESAEGFNKGQDYTVKITVLDNLIKVYLDGQLLFERQDNSFATGKIGLYNWANTGAEYAYVQVTSPDVEVYRLFEDAFAKNDLTAWTIEDLGPLSAPSSWQLDQGRLHQTSNIRNNVTQEALNKQGTIIHTGDANWSDLLFSVSVRSESDDEFGVVFRYQDAQNHYRFTMNRQGGYRRLMQVNNGTWSLLWEDDYAFELDRLYALVVVLQGDHIQVYVDQVLAVSAKASAHATGKIGLHCWASENTWFSNVQVYDAPVIQEQPILKEDFDGTSLLIWTIFDEAKTGTSQWIVQNDALEQQSNIWGGSLQAADLPKPGTYAICEQTIADDFRLQVIARNADNDAIGVVFRYQDGNNFYRFSIDDERNYRRLVKKQNGVYSLLWEDTSQGYDSDYNQVFSIDVLGPQFSIYLNGVLLATVADGTFSKGKVGCYSWASQGAAFEQLHVLPAVWHTYYQFGKEARHPDGCRFRIYAGNASNAVEAVANLEQRYKADLDQTGQLHFKLPVQQLRLQAPKGDCLHETTFIQASEFANEPIKVLRKRDGTGLFVFKANGGNFAAGQRQLEWTFRRDNQAVDADSAIWRQAGDSSDESVVLNIPWALNDE